MLFIWRRKKRILVGAVPAFSIASCIAVRNQPEFTWVLGQYLA